MVRRRMRSIPLSTRWRRMRPYSSICCALSDRNCTGGSLKRSKPFLPRWSTASRSSLHATVRRLARLKDPSTIGARPLEHLSRDRQWRRRPRNFTKGWTSCAWPPDDIARQRQELELRSSLGTVVRSAKGFAAPETREAPARAGELCYGSNRARSPNSYTDPLLSHSITSFAALTLPHRLDQDLLRLSRQRSDSAGLVSGAPVPRAKYHAYGRVSFIPSHLEETLTLCRSHSQNSLMRQAGVRIPTKSPGRSEMMSPGITR
jgi:hypothetical protein